MSKRLIAVMLTVDSDTVDTIDDVKAALDAVFPNCDPTVWSSPRAFLTDVLNTGIIPGVVAVGVSTEKMNEVVAEQSAGVRH